jgi:MFS family permease
MPDILLRFNLEPAYLSYLSSAVQAGFISGTLIFAILGISDRYSPSKVFCFSALLASVINLAVLINTIDSNMLMLIRFLTGFFLAGIYPVGMKIAADHYEKGLGRSLGFLVGALVLGTAFPHLLKSMTGSSLPWK